VKYWGHKFFFPSKKSPWHSGTKGVFGLLVLVLANNSCARGSISSGTPWHNMLFYAISMYSARGDFFVFKNKKFA
tara:strand:+ start:301 stop:525 length:225 start_codon:yes stop_codon:yes gene_type:complete